MAAPIAPMAPPLAPMAPIRHQPYLRHTLVERRNYPQV